MNYYILLICLLSFISGKSQSLVHNYSFETYSACPDNHGQIGNSLYWSSANDATPDYFPMDCPNFYPYHWWPCQQQPKTGKAFAGIFVYRSSAEGDYREYIQAPLAENLEAGKKYCLKINVSLAQASGVALKEIGYIFSDEKTVMNNTALMNVSARTLQKKDNSVITGINQWVCISDTFTATGMEQFLLIGNFKSNAETEIIKIAAQKRDRWDKSYKEAYYYLDDILLMPAEDSCECTYFNKAIAEKENIILYNVYFESDKSNLLPSSQEELNELYNFLKANKNVHILISGHTDSTGTEEHNIKLSTQRAKAVYNYLMEKGISRSQLSYKGYGASQPIAENNTPQGRQQNRRVEFRIIRKIP